MITEQAIVIAYQNGKVTVECQANQSCGGCASKTNCGTAALSELTGKSTKYQFTFPCSRPMQIGEIVEIGLPEQSLLKLALIGYTLPLMVLIISVFVGNYCFTQEWQNILFTVFSTACAFVVVKVINHRLQQQQKYQPYLIERIL
ncbi:SoxR reducing system RseC family protein [Gallibacterium trehalosifermentans]|uniref:SoxR reducing system RseC family protein n=1 Tax=Gallibacterium trehalosifermentans TaxID=516935 RepID=A0ABV6H1Y2_9PAST